MFNRTTFCPTGVDPNVETFQGTPQRHRAVQSEHEENKETETESLHPVVKCSHLAEHVGANSPWNDFIERPYRTLTAKG